MSKSGLEDLAGPDTGCSSVWDYSEKLVRQFGLYKNILNYQLKKLGLKGKPSNYLISCINSLKHDACSILDALIESGYKYYNSDEYFIINDNQLSSALDMLDVEDAPSKYLNVFRKLKEKLGYKTVDVSEQLLQIDKISKISRLKGDVCRAIDILAEVDYSLKTFKGKKMLLYEELDVFRDLAQVDADKFLKTFYRLKEKLGYKTINAGEGYADQVRMIIGILQEIDNPHRVIDVLAENYHYKLEKSEGITKQDLECMKLVSHILWDQVLMDIHVCAYKEGIKTFIELFNTLNVDDRKKLIKAVFNCNETSNYAIITWLDKNYSGLVREVGLSLV